MAYGCEYHGEDLPTDTGSGTYELDVSVPCPVCKAVIGQPCDGSFVRSQAVHYGRRLKRIRVTETGDRS